MALPRLALVPGEPAGVGPELCVRLAHRENPAVLVALADPAVMLEAAERLALPLELLPPDAAMAARPGQLALQPVLAATAADPGHPDPANAPSLIDALLMGAEGCLEGGYDGLVTGPVQKAAINQAGIPYTGTTGLLSEHAGCEVVMMLANPVLRVALVTTHLPLREVADAVTAGALERTLRILHGALQADFAIERPRIAVLGLNPHAGEQGHLGREEIEVINPVLEALRGAGMDLRGPLPADTAFLPDAIRGFDAVLAMYHDQGLPVLKHSGFEQAVNLTLGLPYPRVAVDHGTALDLAGRGLADPSSLFAAVDTCAAMARARRARRGVIA